MKNVRRFLVSPCIARLIARERGVDRQVVEGYLSSQPGKDQLIRLEADQAHFVLSGNNPETAGNALSIEFDATPWFREADHQSILHLADQDCSSVWVADALETLPGYKGLHQLIEYAATRLRKVSLEDPTWASLDCINSSDAKQWLAENRPEIAMLLQDEHKPG